MKKERWNVGLGLGCPRVGKARERGVAKNMLFGGGARYMRSLFQGHSPGGATVYSMIV